MRSLFRPAAPQPAFAGPGITGLGNHKCDSRAPDLCASAIRCDLLWSRPGYRPTMEITALAWSNLSLVFLSFRTVGGSGPWPRSRGSKTAANELAVVLLETTDNKLTVVLLGTTENKLTVVFRSFAGSACCTATKTLCSQREPGRAFVLCRGKRFGHCACPDKGLVFALTRRAQAYLWTMRPARADNDNQRRQTRWPFP